jgi:aspartate kinase
VALLVQKFGGTSVGSLERIRGVAERVRRSALEGNKLIVVVSAMAGETNRLIGMGHELAKHPLGRELDALASTGEQVTAALLSIALNNLGTPARSFVGHQVKVLTDSAFTKARIKTIDVQTLTQTLDDGHVAVVAGFQGVDEKGNITTLGRGGSDTSAVAIAAAVKADVCEIYTDVDGVYTTDPNICRNAKKIERVSFEEMLELASLGAKVLQIRSVEVAMKYGIPIHVRSSFSEASGTWVMGEDSSLESMVVTGVTSDKNEVKLNISAVPDQPGTVAKIFEPLAEAKISVDMIIQNAPAEGLADITFTVSKSDAHKAQEIARQVAQEIGAKSVQLDTEVVKVSIVGMGMRSHSGIAATMFRLLAREGINIIAISTSEIKVSCLLHSRYAELAVRVLHDGFGLGDG